MNRIPYTFGVAPKINFLQSYTATQNEQETTKTIKETAHISRKNSSYELAVSRALGNRDLKPICSAMPAVQSYAMSAPGFIILASDGLWDGMSHQAAVDIVLHKFMESGKNFESFEQQDVQKIAQSLVEHGKTYFSSDDITVTIVFFRPS
jgi:serine/threonine protein phosphatase PrpC